MENLRINKEGKLVQPKERPLKFDPGYIPLHHRWTPYTGPTVWTGPEGQTDYRLKTYRDWQVLGIGELSPEMTRSTNHLTRAPANQAFPKARTNDIGEIGWFYKKYNGSIKRAWPDNMDR